MGGRGAKSSVSRSAGGVKVEVINGEKKAYVGVYGKEYANAKEVQGLIDSSKSALSKINLTINSLPEGTQRKKWEKKRAETKKDIENYKNIKKELSLFGKDVVKKLPKGWKEDKGATTAPNGYTWVTNGKSRFSGERKSALIKNKDLRK